MPPLPPFQRAGVVPTLCTPIPASLIDIIPQKNTFQSIFDKVGYIRIIHQLVGHVYSLVPLAMADHRLARQIPRRCCNMFFYY